MQAKAGGRPLEVDPADAACGVAAWADSAWAAWPWVAYVAALFPRPAVRRPTACAADARRAAVYPVAHRFDRSPRIASSICYARARGDAEIQPTRGGLRLDRAPCRTPNRLSPARRIVHQRVRSLCQSNADAVAGFRRGGSACREIVKNRPVSRQPSPPSRDNPRVRQPRGSHSGGCRSPRPAGRQRRFPAQRPPKSSEHARRAEATTAATTLVIHSSTRNRRCSGRKRSTGFTTVRSSRLAVRAFRFS